MKTELVNYLKTKQIFDVFSLWGEAKTYYKDRCIEMGGSYASWGKSISVTLNICGKLERFKVSIDECA